MEDLFEAEWDALWDKQRSSGYDSLSEVEKNWFNLGLLHYWFGNGGLFAVFYNDGTDHFLDTLSALEEIGCNEVADLLRQIGALFGDSVPDSMDRRNQVIDSWPKGGHQGNVVNRVCDAADTAMHTALGEKIDAYLIRAGYGRVVES